MNIAVLLSANLRTRNAFSIYLVIAFQVWESTLSRVSTELGDVIFAGAFGSQRYNCHVASSDVDMFVVYQATTNRLLGFDPPKQTVKVTSLNTLYIAFLGVLTLS